MAKPIGDVLRAAIIASGISQADLARATGVEQSSISRFLGGKDIGLRKAGHIATHLGMELVMTSDTEEGKP
ncbi:MAG TPA: helix-turn-helix transcriptional regulator [Pirellulales bacterium]|jgi:transcriptional regulator with XRE-family HTH domain